VTSLIIRANVVTLVQVRDIMVQLPNLDNLSLLGDLPVDGRESPGIGAVVRGKFSGRLILVNGYNEEDIINMLLEIPSGLRFTEVQLKWSLKGFPSLVRLVEACGKTIVKLSHRVETYGKSHHSS